MIYAPHVSHDTTGNNSLTLRHGPVHIYFTLRHGPVNIYFNSFRINVNNVLREKCVVLQITIHALTCAAYKSTFVVLTFDLCESALASAKRRTPCVTVCDSGRYSSGTPVILNGHE